MIIIELKSTIFICANIHYCTDRMCSHCAIAMHIDMLEMLDARCSSMILLILLSLFMEFVFKHERLHIFNCIFARIRTTIVREIRLWIVRKRVDALISRDDGKEATEKRKEFGWESDTFSFFFRPKRKNNEKNLWFHSRNHWMQKKIRSLFVIVSLKILLPDIF